MTLNICVPESSSSPLVLQKITLTTTRYPLNVRASISNISDPSSSYLSAWTISLRTLRNCMHDTYQDCPFYEQLQYAMDTRSSILFTYAISGDDRLARNAIIQLHNTYEAGVGLTGSRAPSHQAQIIPHFSLFWILMVVDHYERFGDKQFTLQFQAVVDGILGHFDRRIDHDKHLVSGSDYWDFVDWAEEWRPMGIPPAVERTGYNTFTSLLYAFTLKRASTFRWRKGLREGFANRAEEVLSAVREHCLDQQTGFFTDGLSPSQCSASGNVDYSVVVQVWAILSGAVTGGAAVHILDQALADGTTRRMTQASTAMSFYTLRALSLTGLYDKYFHSFWEPWRQQMSNRLSTWEEDDVSQRSDCHAWGCAMLYELPVEVAGVRFQLAEDGQEGKLIWRPRLGLFREFGMVVPFGGQSCSGKTFGTAVVKWEDQGTEHVHCSLKLSGRSSESGNTDTVPGKLVVETLLPDMEIQKTEIDWTRQVEEVLVVERVVTRPPGQ